MEEPKSHTIPEIIAWTKIGNEKSSSTPLFKHPKSTQAQ
jgi:hypothetical protein